MAPVGSVEVQRVRRLIDGLRRDRRTHPHHGRREYSQRARDVAAACAALIETEPAAVPALTQRAVERVTTALTHMDDSAGTVGDDLHTLMEVHARACAAAPPDPKRLAAWLATMRLDGPGWPDVELRDFAAALGQDGCAELSRIVEERAATAEPDVFGRTPFGIRMLREQLAEISGDVDRYVAVVAENLYAASQYLKIVAALQGAGRVADAEQWAQHGLTGLANPIDRGKLRDAHVELLLDRGAYDAALALRQELFDQNPTQFHYHELRRTAQRTGYWTGTREQAIRRLRDAVAGQHAFANHLIGVLLDEHGDEHEYDEAWQVAVDHPAALPESRWQQLIDLRQPSHPAEVIEPLQRLIEQRLANSSDKYRYTKAIKMIRQLRNAHDATDDTDGFATYIEDLRHRHKRKTSFTSKLERAKL